MHVVCADLSLRLALRHPRIIGYWLVQYMCTLTFIVLSFPLVFTFLLCVCTTYTHVHLVSVNKRDDRVLLIIWCGKHFHIYFSSTERSKGWELKNCTCTCNCTLYTCTVHVYTIPYIPLYHWFKFPFSFSFFSSPPCHSFLSPPPPPPSPPLIT